jgi:hypothetical protein
MSVTINGTTGVTTPSLDNDGGTIDGTTIGGTTAAAGSFTTLIVNTDNIYVPADDVVRLNDKVFIGTGTGVSSALPYNLYVAGSTESPVTFTTLGTASTGATGIEVDISNVQGNTNNTFLSGYQSGYGFRVKIYGNGDIQNSNGVYGTLSDIKHKNILGDASSQWDDIKSVRMRKYTLKTDPDGLAMIGVVAQELAETSPGLVYETDDYEQKELIDEDGAPYTVKVPTGTKTMAVKTSILHSKALVALQEAMRRIEALENQLMLTKP